MLLADDHPVVRQGLCAFLDLQDDIEVIGEAADGNAAVARILELAPDVVLLDLKMPGMDGQEVLRQLSSHEVASKVIILTSVAATAEVPQAVRAGAAGFLYKDIDPDALAQAIRSVYDGQMLFSREAASAMVAAPEPSTALTDREQQVLALVAVGRSNREIARELSVTEKTVKTHVSAVLRKLGVADRTQAALWAVRNGAAAG